MPSNITAENDTHNLIVKKNYGFDINTAYVIAMSEVYLVLKKRNPKLADKSLKAAILAWKYLVNNKLTKSPDIGMFIWATMRLYEATRKKKYIKTAKEYTKKLLPLPGRN